MSFPWIHRSIFVYFFFFIPFSYDFGLIILFIMMHEAAFVCCFWCAMFWIDGFISWWAENHKIDENPTIWSNNVWHAEESVIVNKEKQIHGILLLNLFINSNATIESNGIAFQTKKWRIETNRAKEDYSKKKLIWIKEHYDRSDTEQYEYKKYDLKKSNLFNN